MLKQKSKKVQQDNAAQPASKFYLLFEPQA